MHQRPDRHRSVTTALPPGLIAERLLPDGGHSPGNDPVLLRAMTLMMEAERLLDFQRARIAQLEELVITDELTRLRNRRGFLQDFERELASARRDSGAGGVLVLFDLDTFKAVNDDHGHPTGDAYLCAFARALLEQVRATDSVARLGGDEFALLLTRTDPAAGMACATRLAETLNALTLCCGGLSLPAAASFGCANYGRNDSVEATMAIADAALYRAKAATRRAKR